MSVVLPLFIVLLLISELYLLTSLYMINKEINRVHTWRKDHGMPTRSPGPLDVLNQTHRLKN